MKKKNNNYTLTDTDIAITAYTGKLPNAENTTLFWNNILHSRVAPLVSLSDRWNVPRDFYFNSEQGLADKIYQDKAYCLENGFIDLHDYQVKTGTSIIKQLLVNTDSDTPFINTSRTGLIIACSNTDEGFFNLDTRLQITNDADVNTNRKTYSIDEQLRTIAEAANLEGPQLSVDTACASSLYALDMAIKQLQTGRADYMLVMGLNLSLTLNLTAVLSQLMVLSPEGQILPFAQNASGIILGEAATCVLVEPLAQAIQSGKKIHAVIKSIGLSSDGAEGSIFAPSPESQILAYERAYKNIDPATINYIEAHGTATLTGDNAEISSINSFFGQYFDKSNRIPAGSIKALVGHGLAASGMNSLIKCLLMLKHKTIPAHIDIKPHDALHDSCIYLPNEIERFETVDRPFRISISSFGMGGSNAHMIIESYNPATKTIIKKSTSSPRFEPIAITDFEAILGDMLEVKDWHKRLHAKKQLYEKFPDDRFSFSSEHRPEGLFLPEKTVIESIGLRLGPKLLKKVDPLQNLVSHLINKMAKRREDIRDSDNTGIIMSSNLGGSKILQLSRKTAFRREHYTLGKNIPEACKQESTIEEITSSMPSMCSGYPAFHFNIKGFHETLCGGPETFTSTLLTAPCYLADNCTTLLTGGAFFINSPAIMQSEVVTGCHAPVVEGTGIFVIKTLAHAVKSKDTIYAIIKNIVPASEAPTFQAACAKYGIKPESIDIREVIDISPLAKNCKAEHFLYEASGVDALLNIILKGGRTAAIEVYRDNELYTTIFLEKPEHLSLDQHFEELSIKLPTIIEFNDPCLPGIPGAKRNTRDIPEKNYTVTDTNTFLDWHTAASGLLVDFIKQQKKIMDQLRARGNRTDVTGTSGQPGSINTDTLRDFPEHIVIHPVKNAGNEMFSTSLIIDESHPFFFDHPLDHVPGILLIEGIAQTIEAVQKYSQSPDAFISQFDITYKKWCEKDAPVTIQLNSNKNNNSKDDSLTIDVIQNDSQVCSVKAEISPLHTLNLPITENRRSLDHAKKCSNLNFVHKHKSENVFISDIDQTIYQADKTVKVSLLPPPENHQLADGDNNFTSVLYFLEVSRQCLNLYAHSIAGVEAGEVSMTLLANTIKLARPIDFNEALHLSYSPSNHTYDGSSYFSTDEVFLVDSKGNHVGTCSIFSQTQPKDRYKQQRKK